MTREQRKSEAREELDTMRRSDAVSAEIASAGTQRAKALGGRMKRGMSYRQALAEKTGRNLGALEVRDAPLR